MYSFTQAQAAHDLPSVPNAAHDLQSVPYTRTEGRAAIADVLGGGGEAEEEARLEEGRRRKIARSLRTPSIAGAREERSKIRRGNSDFDGHIERLPILRTPFIAGERGAGERNKIRRGNSGSDHGEEVAASISCERGAGERSKIRWGDSDSGPELSSSASAPSTSSLGPPRSETGKRDETGRERKSER